MVNRIIPLILIASATTLLFFSSRSLADSLPKQDFAAYWAASRLLGEDPYSVERTYELEIRSGLAVPHNTLVIRNPPWALPFVLPFRFFNYRNAFALWEVFIVASVAGCARILWQLFTPRSSLEPAFVSLLFGPTLVTLMLGQFSVLGLIGLTALLYFLKHGSDRLAGTALLLLFLKPHLVVPGLLILFIWTVTNKRWRILEGAAIALGLASGIAIVLNPSVFQQYAKHLHQFTGELVPYPNLGGILFLLSRHHAFALLPAFGGILWALYYAWRKRTMDWDIVEVFPLLIVVSLVCTYYSYSYDELLALPALLFIGARGNRVVFWAGYLLVELGYVLYFANFGAKTGLDYMFLSWISLALLATYLLGTTNRPKIVALGSS